MRRNANGRFVRNVPQNQHQQRDFNKVAMMIITIIGIILIFMPWVMIIYNKVDFKKSMTVASDWFTIDSCSAHSERDIKTDK